MPSKRFEFRDGKSSKFWEVGVKGSSVTVRFGRIGTDGQVTLKEFPSAAEAKAHADKVTAEKLRKGYAPAAGASKSGSKAGSKAGAKPVAKSAAGKARAVTAAPARGRGRAKPVASPSRKSPARRAKAAPAATKAGAPAARRLRRPKTLKGARDNYLLVLSDSPDRVDGWELAQLVYGGNEGAGDITPPNGLGDSVFGQELMDETWGDVPVATCRTGIDELKGIIRDHVSALGFEERGVVYEISEGDFLDAVRKGRWKFVKFVHVEDE